MPVLAKATNLRKRSLSKGKASFRKVRKADFCDVAERMRLERTMPCGTPHFQCGSLPLEYLSISLRLSYYIQYAVKNQALFPKKFLLEKREKKYSFFQKII